MSIPIAKIKLKNDELIIESVVKNITIGADEIAVQVRKLDGTIDLMVYSFSMGSLRAVKDYLKRMRLLL